MRPRQSIAGDHRRSALHASPRRALVGLTLYAALLLAAAPAAEPLPAAARAGSADPAAGAGLQSAGAAPQLAVEDLSVEPVRIPVGGSAEILTEYRLDWPAGAGGRPVHEHWSVWRDGRRLNGYDQDQVDRSDGGWLVTLTLSVPADAPAGTYELRHRLSAAGASAEQRTSFVVAPAAPPEQLAEWLAAGRAALADKRLLTPRETAAVTYARRVLEADPGNADALALIREAIDTYLGWAEAQIGGYRLSRARGNLRKVRSIETYASEAQRDRRRGLERRLSARQAAARRRAAAAAKSRPRSPERKEPSGAIGSMKRVLESADCAIQRLLRPDYCD